MERNSSQRRSVLAVVFSLTLAACVSSATPEESPEESPTTSAATSAPSLISQYRVPDAVAMNVTTNGAKTVVAWTDGGAAVMWG